jgi:hypothetical protein
MLAIAYAGIGGGFHRSFEIIRDVSRILIFGGCREECRVEIATEGDEDIIGIFDDRERGCDVVFLFEWERGEKRVERVRGGELFSLADEARVRPSIFRKENGLDGWQMERILEIIPEEACIWYAGHVGSDEDTRMFFLDIFFACFFGREVEEVLRLNTDFSPSAGAGNEDEGGA